VAAEGEGGGSHHLERVVVIPAIVLILHGLGRRSLTEFASLYVWQRTARHGQLGPG
jgi:hypothetical protein